MAFAKKAIEGKGFGYIATEDILPNTLILEEIPYITSSEHFGKHALDEVLYVVDNVINNKYTISEKLYDKFMLLAPLNLKDVDYDQFVNGFVKRAKQYNSSLKTKILKKIKFPELILLCLKYQRNVFIFDDNKGALCEKASSFNHSCEPNCKFYYEGPDYTEQYIKEQSLQKNNRNYNKLITYVQLIHKISETRFLATVLNVYCSEYESTIIVMDTQSVAEIPFEWNDQNKQTFADYAEIKEGLGFQITGLGAIGTNDNDTFIELNYDGLF
jgi:hypothetical protein